MKVAVLGVFSFAFIAVLAPVPAGSVRQPMTSRPQLAEPRAVSDVTLRLQTALPSAASVVRLTRNTAGPSWLIAEEIPARLTGGNLTVRGPVGVETLLMMRTPGHAGYLLYGPFRWPTESSTYFMGTRWRKTVAGRSVRGPGPISWVGSEDAAGEAFPSCDWTTDTTWECIGIPLDATGVVVFARDSGVECAVPAGPLSSKGLQLTRSHVSTWGRLLIVSSGRLDADVDAAVRVSARRLETPRARPQAIRLEEVADERVHLERVASGVVWVGGGEIPVAGWIEIASGGRATERIDTSDIAAAPELPLRIQLQRSNPIAGHVTSGKGAGAPGTVVTLYRFIKEPGERTQDPVRRVSVRETWTDADGAFRFEDLAQDSYEIIAMHPSLGRAARRVEPDGQDLEITLRPPSHVVGRVLRDGAPARGIPVVIVPDLAEFAAMADLTELRGGETETDLDGRFSVALGSRGTGELRIGNDGTGVRRVPLAAAEAQARVVDVGTIELVTQSPLTLVLEGADGCGLLLTGPLGRTGLTVVRASSVGPAMFEAAVPEAGRWQVVAVCGGRERAVLPPTISVPPGARDLTVRLTWP